MCAEKRSERNKLKRDWCLGKKAKNNSDGTITKMMMFSLIVFCLTLTAQLSKVMIFQHFFFSQYFGQYNIRQTWYLIAIKCQIYHKFSNRMVVTKYLCYFVTIRVPNKHTCTPLLRINKLIRTMETYTVVVKQF